MSNHAFQVLEMLRFPALSANFSHLSCHTFLLPLSPTPPPFASPPFGNLRETYGKLTGKRGGDLRETYGKTEGGGESYGKLTGKRGGGLTGKLTGKTEGGGGETYGKLTGNLRENGGGGNLRETYRKLTANLRETYGKTGGGGGNLRETYGKLTGNLRETYGKLTGNLRGKRGGGGT